MNQSPALLPTLPSMRLTVRATSAFIASLALIIAGSRVQAQVYEPISAAHGMVVSTEPTASRVGVDVLRRGGNAMDAAIATAFALAVTYPSCGNLGGGGFLTYYQAGGAVTTIDFRIAAPASASANTYLGADEKLFDTIKAAGVPGTVAGLELAHKKYGSLPWADLVSPSVKLAKEGFPLYLKLLNEINSEQRSLQRYPSSSRVFLRADGSSYELGHVIRQPELARTLERIQRGGARGFYDGQTADLLARYAKENDGLITAQDLREYRAYERTPVHGRYREYDIYSAAPPSRGGVILIETLNVLEHYNLKQLGHNSANYLHLLSKALGRAYRDADEHIGDPMFVHDMPVERLTSKEYANEMAAAIEKGESAAAPPNDSTSREKRETTHFSVIDSKGNAVSLTYTLDGDFGSYGIVEGAGFFLNNEMQEFDVAPNASGQQALNRIQPGKRPHSCMSPTVILKDGKLKFILGTPGGQAIPSSLVQIVANLLDFDMNLAEAVSAKRFFYRWGSDELFVENAAITKDTQELLERLGHKVQSTDWRMCNAMCIAVDSQKNLYYGAADPRSLNGTAIGY